MVRRIPVLIALALVAGACGSPAIHAAPGPATVTVPVDSAPPQSTGSTGSSTASPMTTVSSMTAATTLAPLPPWVSVCGAVHADVMKAQPPATWAAAIAAKLADPRFTAADFGISVWVDGFG